MILRAAIFLIAACTCGCAYHLGGAGQVNGGGVTVTLRPEVENLTGIPGMGHRFLGVLAEEAEILPGVRLASGAKTPLRVTLKGARRLPVALDDLGRPTESRMALTAVASLDGSGEWVELDSLTLASGLVRSRRTLNAGAAEDAALRAVARAVLGMVVGKGGNDAFR